MITGVFVIPGLCGLVLMDLFCDFWRVLWREKSAWKKLKSFLNQRSWRVQLQRSAGMSTSLKVAPLWSPSQMTPFILTKSTTPTNLSSAPIGNWIGQALPPNFSQIFPETRPPSNRTRSSPFVARFED